MTFTLEPARTCLISVPPAREQKSAGWALTARILGGEDADCISASTALRATAAGTPAPNDAAATNSRRLIKCTSSGNIPRNSRAYYPSATSTPVMEARNNRRWPSMSGSSSSGGSGPIFLTGSKVSLHHVRIQLDAQAGFVRQRDVSVFHDGSIVQNHIIHPAAIADDGFGAQKIANRAGPLHDPTNGDNAAGVVRAHGYRVGLGEIGDLLGLEQAARVSNVELRDVEAPVDDEIRESLAARQILAREDGHFRSGRQPHPGFGKVRRHGILKP